MTITHGSLFSGGGGFDLAAQCPEGIEFPSIGWENLFTCELDSFCQNILKHYWPNSKHHGDITKTDFTIWRHRAGVISGGFPCQPFSVAGNRAGTNDNRYLWPEMLRAIREIKPFAVVGENVTGLLTMEQQEVFARVDSRNRVSYQDCDHYEAIYARQSELLLQNIIQDIEEEGYAVQTFVIPAAGVGAPHKRDRVWIVAYSDDRFRDWKKRQAQAGGGYTTNSGLASNATTKYDRRGKSQAGPRQIQKSGVGVKPSSDSHAPSNRLQGRRDKGELPGQGPIGKQRFTDMGGVCARRWQDFPTQPPVCGRDDGLPRELDGITFSKWRSESIKLYGNAIVPQIVVQIFNAINHHVRH